MAGFKQSKRTNPSNGDVDDEDEYDDGNRSIILSLIGQLRPGSDLSRITLPTFILERKSMLERITNTLQHPGMLSRANDETNPEKRFLEVVRWYMSGWHIAPKAVKKPLNPVLGEYFSCYWDVEPSNGQSNPGDTNRQYYIAEQTSHHPPKSSYFFTYPDRKIRADGIVIPVSKFLGNSAGSIMEGLFHLEFGEHTDKQGNPEIYKLTQPNIYARGILVGGLKLEMGDKAYISCPALDLECTIEFKVKGYISGTYNEIKGTITKNGKTLYELSGKWNEVIYVSQGSKGKKEVFFDTKNDTVSKPQVRALSEQGNFESRKLWHNVILALGERNQKAATDEKFEIEDYQRQLQKLRQEGKAPPFHPKLFAPENSEIEFVVAVTDALRKAKTSQEAEQVLQSLMPVLPGTPFPEDFESSGQEKAENGHGLNAAAQQGSTSNNTSAGASTGANSSTEAGAAGAAGAGAAGAGAAGAAHRMNTLKLDGDEFHDALESI